MMKRLEQKTIRVTIERGKKGLWYGTSKDLKGLLVTGMTRSDVIEAAPGLIADLYLASGVKSVDLLSMGALTWLARPDRTQADP
jgi:hypothetical protein